MSQRGVGVQNVVVKDMAMSRQQRAVVPLPNLLFTEAERRVGLEIDPIC
jgi:hypothetical protein